MDTLGRLVGTIVFLVIFASGAKSNEVLGDIRRSCSPDGPAHVVLLASPGNTQVVACGRDRPSVGQATAESRFLLASVSKTFLAVTLLQLHEEGQINIDDRASKWLPPDVVTDLGGLKGVTISHLLSMTSGLPDYLDEQFYLDSLDLVDAGATSAKVLRSALKKVVGEPVLFAAGTAFDYSNTNYLLAQLVLEKVSGQPMHEVFNSRIFEPMGLNRTQLLGFGVSPGDFVQGFEDFGNGLEAVDGYLEGFGFGDGGLISTAGEVAGFYDALFSARTLLDKRSLDRLLTDPVGEGYGMGIEVERLPDNVIVVGHSGGDIGFSTDVRHILGEGVSAVYLSAIAEDDLSVTWDLLEAHQGN